MKKLIFALTCLLFAIPCQARIITVDDNETADFNNIQAAIDDSNDDDTIIVADGTYTGVGNRDIDFLGKAITLRSENGPENCIIDCQGSKSDKHRGFHFHSNEDANSLVDGFTITNGWGPIETIDTLDQSAGGGIYCYQSSPKIKNCIIKDNMASNEGSLIVGSGAGIFCNYANTVIIDCLIENNGALPGVMGPKPAETVVGGGIIIFGGSATVRECIIIGNEAGMGGGIICWESEVTLLNCNINNNIAVSGAGLHLNGNILVSNCTICDNKKHPDCPTCESGGILWPGFGNLMVRNCIVWGNDGNEIQGTGVDVTYSAIKGGYKGTGNINVNPDFADPCNGDYHLKSQAGRWDPNSKSWVVDDVTSPCIDAGNPGCPLGDEPAPNGNRMNMGAYGGTAEASKSPANWRNIADMTNDWVVDSNDLKVFVGYWLQMGECIPSDLNRSQSVGFDDFAFFGLQWSYPSASEPGITYYQIKDCDPNSFRSLATEQAIETRFTVTVEGRYIHFVDMMVANCCKDKIELQMVVEENIIIIREIEYVSAPCFCICDYPITATLGPFEPGVYTLEVYEDWGGFIGNTTVVIDLPE